MKGALFAWNLVRFTIFICLGCVIVVCMLGIYALGIEDWENLWC